MPKIPKMHASRLVLIAVASCVALSGCGGVSAPKSAGPAPPPGGTGFTTAAATQTWLQQFGTGTQAQTTTAGALAASGDISTGIATDPSGNVVVAGYTFGALPGSTNPNHAAEDFVGKLNPTGKQVWLQQFGTGAGDFLNAVATDTSGNIFAAGFTTGAFPGATNAEGEPEAVVVKLDANGNQLWLRQFSAGSGLAVRAIAAAPDGSLLVAGVLSQQAEGRILTSQLAFAAKLDGGTGQTVWRQTIGQAGITIFNAIAVDAAGDEYVAGESLPAVESQSTAAPLQSLAMKLSGVDGSTIWLQEGGGGGNSMAESILSGIATGPDGNAVVSGTSFGADFSVFIAKLSGSSGQQLWSTPFGGSTVTFVDNLGVDGAGNVLVAGSTYAALLPQFQPVTDDLYVAKFNSGGQNIWLQQFGTGNELSESAPVLGPLAIENQLQIAVDPQGDAFLGGITLGQFPGFSNPNHALESFVTKFGP